MKIQTLYGFFSFCEIVLKSKKIPSKKYPKELLTIGNHIRKKRLDKKLTLVETASLLDISTSTLKGWEKGKRPSSKSYPNIILFLGYNPF